MNDAGFVDGARPGPPAPPALASLGIERTLWEAGRTALRWAVPEERRLTNTAGHLHGGYLCVMADALLGSALSTVIAPPQRAVNPDFHCHFLERVDLGARLEGEGRLVHRGRSVSFLEASIRDARSGELVLTAHSSGLVVSHEGDRTKPSERSPAARESATSEPDATESPSADGEPPLELSWRLPPWLDDFGARFLARSEGRSGIAWPIAAGRFENRAGTVQGGYLCLVADAAMGFALIHGAPDAWAMATTSLSMQFVRPARPGMLLEAEAWVERRGRRFGFMACELRAAGKLIARGRSSGLLRLRSDGSHVAR